MPPTITRSIGARALFLLAIGALAACAGEPRADGGLAVVEAWSRPAGEGTTGAAYVTLENRDADTVHITSVRSRVTSTVELHETVLADGVARMRPWRALAIAPRSTLVMEPGGLHLMLVDLQRAMNAGDTVSLTLLHASGDSTMALVRVRTP